MHISLSLYTHLSCSGARIIERFALIYLSLKLYVRTERTDGRALTNTGMYAVTYKYAHVCCAHTNRFI